jgi:hypothetical protein
MTEEYVEGAARLCGHSPGGTEENYEMCNTTAGLGEV